MKYLFMIVKRFNKNGILLNLVLSRFIKFFNFLLSTVKFLFPFTIIIIIIGG